jgi:hypothetical protein
LNWDTRGQYRPPVSRSSEPPTPEFARILAAPGKNIQQFAEKHGIGDSGLRAVLNGRLHSCQSWTKWKNGKVKRIYHLLSPPPEQTLYEIKKLSEFARDRGLDSSCLSRCMPGKNKSPLGLDKRKFRKT